jgi:ATP-dependent phosphofructokinase / diphosphate-dependent phosphofructokinase
MDNDVRNTEYCIGFSTAITRATDAIARQRTTVGSHERIGIFRVFGRDAGFTSLYTAYVASIRCCIPEYKVNLEKADRSADDRQEKQSQQLLPGDSLRRRGVGGLPGARIWRADAYGHRHKENVAEALASEIKKRRTSEETIVSDLTYDLRSGVPDFVDKLVASTFGTMALEAVLDNQSGLMARWWTGVTRWRPFPIRRWGRGTWTSPPCTTPSAIVRITPIRPDCRSS